MAERLDKHLVNINIAGSRAKSKELIKSRNVKVNGKVVTKCSHNIKRSDNVEITDNSTLRYVSRAGQKLEGAIESFSLDFNGKNVMDIGSSTGGFTDCLLKHGARRVVAIDVGTDLMDERLREDGRVELHEQLNFRNAPTELFNGIDIMVSDVSFISLKHIIDRISLEDDNYELVFLIKPQFECGKETADRFKGIIKDRQVHIDVINNIIDYFEGYGYNIIGLDVSKMPGKNGNVEYLGHFKRNVQKASIDIEKIVS